MTQTGPIRISAGIFQCEALSLGSLLPERCQLEVAGGHVLQQKEKAHLQWEKMRPTHGSQKLSEGERENMKKSKQMKYLRP